MFQITSTDNCGYCTKAKEAITAAGFDFKENLLDTPEKKNTFLEAGYTTVPQIWFNSNYIGGFKELEEYLAKN